MRRCIALLSVGLAAAQRAQRKFAPRGIATGVSADQVRAFLWPGDPRPGILTIGKGVISLWQNQGR